MNDKRSFFEQRVADGEGVVSLINQPLDEPIEPPLTAREIAQRRWHMEPEHERHEA
jgi:hypothetical protein